VSAATTTDSGAVVEAASSISSKSSKSSSKSSNSTKSSKSSTSSSPSSSSASSAALSKFKLVGRRLQQQKHSRSRSVDRCSLTASSPGLPSTSGQSMAQFADTAAAICLSLGQNSDDASRLCDLIDCAMESPIG
uniref:REJ domain-containing protein n=1 Tax=Macrostomum lignano TaxID=282301 RepID=A0A1I8GXJ8_9PLAT